MKHQYYDIKKLLTYNADVNMIIGARGIGKTYSVRKNFIDDYIKHRIRFVEITRYKSETSRISAVYFDRIVENDEYSGWLFKTDARYAYMALKCDKPKWEVCGYFVALSMQQQLKKMTFVNVRNIGMDEIIIDINDRWHHYLPNEWEQLANLVDTVTRERPDDIGLRKPRLFLMGNACDLLNPFFMHYKINDVPQYGVHWTKDKACVVDYVRDDAYAEDKVKNTVAGRMLGDDSDISAYNEFRGINKDFIVKPHGHAKLTYILKWHGADYGVMIDWDCGYVFVTTKFQRNSNVQRFAITTNDNRINYLTAIHSKDFIKSLIEYYSMNFLRYDSLKTQNDILAIFSMYGVR